MHVSYTLLHLSAGGGWVREGGAGEGGRGGRGREGGAGGGGRGGWEGEGGVGGREGEGGAGGWGRRGRQVRGGRVGGRVGEAVRSLCADFCVAMGLLRYLIGLTVCVVDHEE